MDEILAVAGLDAVLIGPHDLWTSLGIPEQYDDPRFLEACEQILGRARRAGIGAGTHTGWRHSSKRGLSARGRTS